MFSLVPDCRHGRFLIPPEDIYVGEALRHTGEYSESEVELFAQLVNKGSRVVEVGSNIGAHTVPLAKLAGEVIAVEPQRWVSQLCAANCVLNDHVNVRVYWAALGAVPKSVPIPMLDPGSRNNFGSFEVQSFDPQAAPIGSIVDVVPQYRLDNLPLNRCSLLKLDVEGMEADVLEGAPRLLAEGRPVVYLEADRPHKRGAAFKILREASYDLFWHRVFLFRDDNWRKTTVNPWPGVVAENVLAVPKEKGIVIHDMPPVLDL